jgi:DNA-binding NtrC family response regulator
MIIQNNKKNILFIDDEIRILRTLKALFRKDYSVHLANSGNEALDLLKKKKMDIVVSDQRMPGLLGNELLSKVRRIQPQAIRMLLTGYLDRKAIIKTINEGEIYRFISKPWDRDEIKEIISDAAIASEIEHIDSGDENTSQEAVELDNRQRLINHGIIKPLIIVLENDVHTRQQIREMGSKIGVQVHFVNKIRGVLGVLHLRPSIGTLLLSLDNQSEDIISALALMRKVRPNLVTIALAETTDSEVAVNLINQSQVFRYLAKPIENEEFEKILVDGLIRNHKLKTNDLAKRRYAADHSKLRVGNLMKKLFSVFSSNAPH